MSELNLRSTLNNTMSLRGSIITLQTQIRNSDSDELFFRLLPLVRSEPFLRRDQYTSSGHHFLSSPQL